MAAQDNTSTSDMDKTAFWVTGLCAICHPGGGFTEIDRDGHKYYDVTTDTFGYEAEGHGSAPAFDGDYAEVTGNGTSGAPTGMRDAPWDVTGVAEPDCLYCHRAERTVQMVNDQPMPANWVWRAATLRKKDALQDTLGQSVPAYAAAATAAQGWAVTDWTVPAPGKPPIANTVDIDYGLGVTDGTLIEDATTGELRVAPTLITDHDADDGVRDFACWACHGTPDLKKRGRSWFDPSKDVHFANFGDLTDPLGGSTACTVCHPLTGDQGVRDREHDIGKGHATLGSVRNDTDWVGLPGTTDNAVKTCVDCHTGPTAPQAPIHTGGHLAAMACEFCHIPYKLDPADIAIDNATSGNTKGFSTDQLYSADPLDPGAPRDVGDHTWWPSAVHKQGRDGVSRIYPVKLLLSVWWGDWQDDGDGIPEAGELVRPLPLWKVRHATDGGTPAGVTNNVNTLAEIALYVNPTDGLLRGDDGTGNAIAANPVLVKGGRMWFWDAGGSAVDSVDYEATGIHTESSHPFSVNHNVLPLAHHHPLGYAGCAECHATIPNLDGPVFDRQILVDPFGTDDTQTPVYETLGNVLAD